MDLVPFKICTYDCIYFQLGRTVKTTMQRTVSAPSDLVIEQVRSKLECKPDYITLSGSGEPTLCSNIEEIILRIKEITDIPLAVLTNGSLLWSPEVRASLTAADLVIPSLDAGTEQVFKYVNRPHPDLYFGKVLGGLVKFRKQSSGRYYLEVLILSGVTTVEAQIDALAKYIKLICPDKVQVNTVHRPPAEDFAMAVAPERLREVASQLSEKAEIIVPSPSLHEKCETSVRLQDVLTLLSRRPCSLEDIALGLGLHRNAAVKYVEQLSSQGQIRVEHTVQGLFYRALL